jgi:hypothetical protein
LDLTSSKQKDELAQSDRYEMPPLRDHGRSGEVEPRIITSETPVLLPSGTHSNGFFAVQHAS